jgi:hypothetical protein
LGERAVDETGKQQVNGNIEEELPLARPPNAPTIVPSRLVERPAPKGV